MKKMITLVITVIFSVCVHAAGFQYHGTSNGISLYYKVTDYGITFKVKNDTSETVHVLIDNVSGSWSDGKRRTEDVFVTYVNPNQTSTSTYDHADNYSKLKNWSFSRWRWSTRYSDIK